jgi:2'-5' RNA ligase
LTRARLAIDLIIVPDDAHLALAREANARLRALGEETTIDLQSALPHISLLMGTVPTARLPLLKESSRPLLDSLPRSLASRGMERFARRMNKDTHWIGLEASPELVALQREATATFAPHLLEGAAVGDFHPGPPHAAESDAEFAGDYLNQATGKRFDPHVTVGRSDRSCLIDFGDLDFPKDLRPRGLALAWLGASCTCPQLLWTLDLADA